MIGRSVYYLIVLQSRAVETKERLMFSCSKGMSAQAGRGGPIIMYDSHISRLRSCGVSVIVIIFCCGHL